MSGLLCYFEGAHNNFLNEHPVLQSHFETRLLSQKFKNSSTNLVESLKCRSIKPLNSPIIITKTTTMRWSRHNFIFQFSTWWSLMGETVLVYRKWNKSLINQLKSLTYVPGISVWYLIFDWIFKHDLNLKLNLVCTGLCAMWSS